jgi:anti-sigma28 factor (negative regulator of flagellin synthesis)
MGTIIPFPAVNMENSQRPKRKRSMTSIALNWLSERMNRTDQLKEAISSGTYQIPIDQVAKAIIHPSDDKDLRESTTASIDGA